MEKIYNKHLICLVAVSNYSIFFIFLSPCQMLSIVQKICVQSNNNNGNDEYDDEKQYRHWTYRSFSHIFESPYRLKISILCTSMCDYNNTSNLKNNLFACKFFFSLSLKKKIAMKLFFYSSLVNT